MLTGSRSRSRCRPHRIACSGMTKTARISRRAPDAPDLLARMKKDYDGAEPAANSVAAMNLLRLWQFTENDAWRAPLPRAFPGRVARSGSAVPHCGALDFWQSVPKEIVIAGDRPLSDTKALVRLMHDRFIPNKVLALADGGPAQDDSRAWCPLSLRRPDGTVGHDLHLQEPRVPPADDRSCRPPACWTNPNLENLRI